MQFGACVEAGDDDIGTNTMKLRTRGCIAIGAAGNWQCSTQFFDLHTGKVVTRIIVTELPMADRVVKCVKNGVNRNVE